MISVGFLRDSRWAGSRLRDSHHRTLSPGRAQMENRIGKQSQTSIAKLGRAVFFGALTTAVGFLALVLSGSMAFSELGVLIAIGIFVAGLFMCSIFVFCLFASDRQFLMIGFSRGATKYVRWIVRKARADADFFNSAFVSPDCDRPSRQIRRFISRPNTRSLATQEYSRESGAGGNHA